MSGNTLNIPAEFEALNDGLGRVLDAFRDFDQSDIEGRGLFSGAAARVGMATWAARAQRAFVSADFIKKI